MAIEISPRQPALAVDAPPGGTGGPSGPSGVWSSDLKKRIWFTLGALVVYRLGTYVPLPGIDGAVLARIAAEHSGGILGVFDMFTGGAFQRMTIFALGIMPYITAAILFQLGTGIPPFFGARKKTGAARRKNINLYIRLLALALAAWQGYGIAVGLEGIDLAGQSAVIQSGFAFRVSTVVTVVAGTAFLMWLAEQITARGLGNGIALIIFAGIVANLPFALGATFEMSHRGILPGFLVFALMVGAVAVTMLIVFVERAQRRFVVQFPERRHRGRVFGGETTFIPLKLNAAGMIPPLFANSILLLPLALADLARQGGSPWLEVAYAYLGRGQVGYLLLYAAFIVLFAFLYAALVFNPTEKADYLKKLGGFVPGITPGRDTANHFRYVLTRLTAVGAVYLAMICVLPEILIAQYAVPFYFGGTSLLIVVAVTLDTVTEMQPHLLAHRYQR